MTDFMTTSFLERKRIIVVIFHVNHLHMKCEALVSLSIAADSNKIAADNKFYDAFFNFR